MKNYEAMSYGELIDELRALRLEMEACIEAIKQLSPEAKAIVRFHREHDEGGHA